eukprot:scaffold7641_cov115-Cylindrotheca_fusiformis.AAC.22
MADAGFIIYSTAIGAFSALFSIWWTCWIFENNPNIPNDRTYLQGLFVLALLASCWFLTFALIQEDVGNLPKSSGERGSVTNLPTSTYAVFCVFISFVLLLWDCFCRGRSCRGQPPHLIPAFPSCFAIGAVCCLVIPGLTFLAVYERESSGSIPNPHQDYVEHLFPKGVAMVVIGFTVNFLALFMYLREKALVPAALQGGGRSDGADLPPGS